MDGDTSVPSQDLCQAGINLDVTQDGNNISRNCTAWCEWFPGPEIEIPNFPVSFGDTVAITICTYGSGASEAQIFFANITANHGTSFILDAGSFSDGTQITLVVILPNGLLSVPKSAETLLSSLTMPKYFFRMPSSFIFG